MAVIIISNPNPTRNQKNGSPGSAEGEHRPTEDGGDHRRQPTERVAGPDDLDR
jgi:hypothetical protein